MNFLDFLDPDSVSPERAAFEASRTTPPPLPPPKEDDGEQWWSKGRFLEIIGWIIIVYAFFSKEISAVQQSAACGFACFFVIVERIRQADVHHKQIIKKL